MKTAILHTVFVSGNSAPSLNNMTMEKLRHHNRKQKELRRLSRTESEVMELLSSPRGYSHKEIASKMYRSTATINTHVRNISKKYGRSGNGLVSTYLHEKHGIIHYE